MTGRGSRGRFAPSPTGDLHLGGARTALAAWLAARAGGGVVVLRMEDIDGPRVVSGAAGRILDDLRALGLDWDEGPDIGGPRGPYVQRLRLARYEAALERLRAAGLVYPCWCSRGDVARAAAGAPSAPHGDEGPRYPGTCRLLTADQRAALERGSRRPALRFIVEAGEVRFDDGVCGPVAQDPAVQVGDFVVRRADGLHAYQLAVVVDDGEMEIEEVVRGDDLLASTARQILLHRALGFASPRFAHVPLVLGPDRRRLSKRHGDISVRALIARGVRPARLLAILAESLGLATPPKAAPRDLVAGFSLARLHREPWVLDASRLTGIC